DVETRAKLAAQTTKRVVGDARHWREHDWRPHAQSAEFQLFELPWCCRGNVTVQLTLVDRVHRLPRARHTGSHRPGCRKADAAALRFAVRVEEVVGGERADTILLQQRPSRAEDWVSQPMRIGEGS